MARGWASSCGSLSTEAFWLAFGDRSEERKVHLPSDGAHQGSGEGTDPEGVPDTCWVFSQMPVYAAQNPDTPNGRHCVLTQEARIRRSQGVEMKEQNWRETEAPEFPGMFTCSRSPFRWPQNNVIQGIVADPGKASPTFPRRKLATGCRSRTGDHRTPSVPAQQSGLNSRGLPSSSAFPSPVPASLATAPLCELKMSHVKVSKMAPSFLSTLTFLFRWSAAPPPPMSFPFWTFTVQLP